MKRIIATIAILPVLLALLLAGCSVSDPDHPQGLTAVSGHRYMSLGNSLTAGYMDSGLIINGQMASYPRLIAQQMGIDVATDGDEFTQPLTLFPGIGSSTPDDPANIAGVLYYNGSGMDIVSETPAVEIMSLLPAATVPTPYHNLGVPGALLIDVMNAYSMESSVSGANPFFDFINRASFFGNLTGDPDTEDPTQQPTMFVSGIAKGANLATLWIGNNDVLGGATGGNPVVGENVTDPTTFAGDYTTLLVSMARGLVQRNGFPSNLVVANIPSITDIPYFMPKAQFELAMGGAWPAGYAEGNDDDGMLVTLPALSYAPDHPSEPLPGNFTLTTAEVETVALVVTSYNQAIASAVSAVNASFPNTCALVDANQIMADLPLPQKTHFLFVLPQVGGDVTAAAATTYFSLDGVHPNQKGYGLLANEFLDVINDLMGTAYAPVDLDLLVWDPEYGQNPPAVAGSPLISSRAGEALENMFR